MTLADLVGEGILSLRQAAEKNGNDSRQIQSRCKTILLKQRKNRQINANNTNSLNNR